MATIHLWARALLRPQGAVAAGGVLIFFSLVPAWFAYGDRGMRVQAFPSALYTSMFEQNPLVLLFPLVVAIPFALAFSGELSHRYAVYTRTRVPLRGYLAARFGANAVVVFITFVLVGLLPQLFVVLGSTTYRPQDYHLSSPSEILNAEIGWTTFSQFRADGTWGLPIAFALWLGINAVLYSSLTMCALVVVSNRALAISLPWMIYLVAYVGMAVMRLEAYGPSLVFPFGLTQLPLENTGYTLLGTGAITVFVVSAVIARAPHLARLQ